MSTALFQDFMAKQGEIFSLQLSEDVSLSTRLVEVSALRAVAPNAALNSTPHDQTPFSLLFKGPAQPVLPQSTYRLKHDGEDRLLDVFLVPVSADATGVHYEAVFS
jgi:hypothetical protein